MKKSISNINSYLLSSWLLVFRSRFLVLFLFRTHLHSVTPWISVALQPYVGENRFWNVLFIPYSVYWTLEPLEDKLLFQTIGGCLKRHSSSFFHPCKFSIYLLDFFKRVICYFVHLAWFIRFPLVFKSTLTFEIGISLISLYANLCYISFFYCHFNSNPEHISTMLFQLYLNDYDIIRCFSHLSLETAY